MPAKYLNWCIPIYICGPMQAVFTGGAHYFATFIDDKSRYVSVYFLKTRDEILVKFKEFKEFAENQTNKKIKATTAVSI